MKKASPKKKTTSKKRAETYDPKLAIKGNFEDVIKVSVGKQPVVKEDNEPKKKKGK